MLRLHGYGKKKNVHKCLTLVIKFYYRIHALRKKKCIKKKTPAYNFYLCLGKDTVLIFIIIDNTPLYILFT